MKYCWPEDGDGDGYMPEARSPKPVVRSSVKKTQPKAQRLSFPLRRLDLDGKQQRQKQPTTYSSASSTTAIWAQISEKEAKTAIDKVVAALRKDSTANSELGRLERVTVVLGYGAPVSGSVAVRFNAQFKKSGFGLSATPLPFGLGQTNKSEGRGTMVGQVKATVDDNTGKVSSCSVFRDLGYGRSFTLKV